MFFVCPKLMFEAEPENVMELKAYCAQRFRRVADDSLRVLCARARDRERQEESRDESAFLTHNLPPGKNEVYCISTSGFSKSMAANPPASASRTLRSLRSAIHRLASAVLLPTWGSK